MTPGLELHLCLCLCVIQEALPLCFPPPCFPLTELVVCDVSLRAPLIMAYISTPPRSDYSPAELKSTVQVCFCVCVYKRARKTEGVKMKARAFSPLGWTLSLHPSDSFLISPIQMAASAGRHASEAREWAPSLLLCRSHLLPSLFALLSTALPCQHIHQHTDAHMHMSARWLSAHCITGHDTHSSRVDFIFAWALMHLSLH